MVARVQVLNSVEKEVGSASCGSKLCFQWVRYLYENGQLDYGFRWIWKDSNGRLMAHRGQARIPNMKMMFELVEEAKKQGWADYDGEQIVVKMPIKKEIPKEIIKSV